ncbi:LOW QUALITY PROTEIN: calcitonin gene-related peptide type 1 receptor-like [Homalodisca vitripennis]|uniref:LOW QUALITY PROTEIN: calcitonin gene-related peptide type 1 receptor-like n=1 Tax=Homalodisca vitripennis TaxID=197043 RepID=UPI001EEAF8B7|nr:LOW QUALITY PROTEIN: calcitonin gene-related peptide type 1 receptor-like [Homalodisca vitripennis]
MSVIVFPPELTTRQISVTEVMCPREFDGWTCIINATSAGDVAYFPCPFFILGFDPKRYGLRVCLEDGSWFKHPESNKTWSNYTTCVDMEDLQLRTQVNFIYKTGYTVSLAALIISIIIFFYFKSLTCTRIQIHKNLFISLALNNCLWLIWYEAVVDNLPVLMENRIECQLLHILVQYFLVATYFWMFCEGLYLHTLLVVTFVTETKVMPFLYPIGWGVPALLVALYAVLRSSRREEKLHCWIHESLYSWTLSGPVCVSMLANLVFLINIVRLLLTKLHTGLSSPKQSFRESLKHASFRSRRKASSTSQTPGPPSGRTKKAVRATLILIPLLGLQYIVMPFRPEQGASWEAIYQIASAVIASCQGLCVALLFCFCNGEVIAAVTKRWKQCRFKKRPCHSCTGITSVSFSRSSYAQEMVPAGPYQEGQDCLALQNVQL